MCSAQSLRLARSVMNVTNVHISVLHLRVQKFFMRMSQRQLAGNAPPVCLRRGRCVLSRETRTQCGACRYERCVRIGMRRPGENAGATGPGALAMRGSLVRFHFTL